MTTGERVSTLEHLVEMDKLLHDIQVELMPEREAAPVLAGLAGSAPPGAPAQATPAQATPTATGPPPPAPPDPAPPSTPGPQLQVASELSARLLASMRELLAGYERVLVPAAARPTARRLTPSRARLRTDDPNVTVAAGPFQSVEALREFEQAVSRLPGVRDVAVRGYEGADRAIIEVRLENP